MIVADANLVLYLLVPGERTAAAEAVYQRDPAWAVPPLCLSEVRNVLLRYVRSGSFSLKAAEAMVDRAEEVLAPYRLEVDSSAVLRLAHAAGLSAYDAEYLALAELLEVPLVTEDRAIRAAAGPATMTPAEFLNSEPS
jgi:predicted nucleic acid-binding protein